MKRFLSQAWAFVVRDFKSELSYRFAFAMQIAGLAWLIGAFWFVALLFGGNVPALERYGGNWFVFVLLGYAPLEFLRVGVMGFSGSIREAQAHGTLEALLVTRASIPSIIFGSVLYMYLRAALRAAIFLGMGLYAAGGAASVNVPALLAFFALAIPCFGALGILSASFVMVFKKGDPISIVVLGTSTFFAGLLFPTELLGKFEFIAKALPLTYAMEGVRHAALGQGLSALAPDLLALAVFSAVLVPLAAWSFRAAVHRARRDGTLSHY